MTSALCREASETYQFMRDEDVAVRARSGNGQAAEYLIAKYRHLVECKARTYFLAGADHEDVVQEGMIGLYKAIRDFRGDRLARFRAFAELCVTRQIITAVKTATRQKHVPLNGYVSLHYPGADPEGEGCLLECLPDERAPDPMQWLIEACERMRLRQTISGALSELETSVLRYYLQGMTYEEMAARLHCRTKCVDNALQRVKRKIDRASACSGEQLQEVVRSPSGLFHSGLDAPSSRVVGSSVQIDGDVT